MTDREKVIRAVETCFDSWIDKRRSMCLDLHKVERLKREALELLKGQEPDETRLVRHYSRPGVYADLWLHCEKCGGKIGDGPYRPKYCPECGRKVNWDD